MTERHAIAYILIVLVILAVGYGATRWRSVKAAERRKLRGYGTRRSR